MPSRTRTRQKSARGKQTRRSSARFAITPLGDCALIIRVGAPNVSDVLRRLKSASVPGVLEAAPAFTTVSLFYDPAQVIADGARADEVFEWLAAKIEMLLGAPPSRPGKTPSSRSIEIPVCYDATFAPDLELVASHAGVTAADVARIHSGANYKVACVGFAPGFPYLTGLPSALSVPRRANPRTQVAPGSVGIGGTQTGIYPQQSPGGWNIIGRTPLRLFNARREQPSLLAMGDAVRFRSITRAEFEAWSE